MLSKKLVALKEINKALSEKLTQIVEEYEKSESELLLGNNIFISDNAETTYQILRLDHHYSSELLSNNEFKRIICLKGLLEIIMPEQNDHAYLRSPNTMLIPPKTKHFIKSIENSEVMIVYKPNFDIGRYKIVEENTIYKKL
ncbi:MAG: hypothetical protein HC836_44840 [Richelia sp. RM2_1_2]|nr:hypothetical protein [Richelia sp. RM2_1_2]